MTKQCSPTIESKGEVIVTPLVEVFSVFTPFLYILTSAASNADSGATGAPLPSCVVNMQTTVA